jgi:signal transduction histidine kinase/ActR/RegA family two-component response regulator
MNGAKEWKNELRTSLFEYLIATSAIVVVTLARVALNPFLLAQHPYAVLYLAVVFVAWFTRVGPSLFATFLGAIAASYFFIPPLYTLALRDTASWVGMGCYWTCSIFLIWVLDSQRQERKRAEYNAAVAQQRLQELLVETAERQKAELSALRAYALIDNLFESAPVGLGFLSSDFRFVRVNRWLAALNRVPREEHTGKTWREIWPYLPEEMETAFRQVLETGKSQINIEINGFADAAKEVPRSWSVSYYPIRLGDEMAGIGAVCEEITERKAKESSSRRAQKLESLGVLAGGAAHVLNNVLTSILGHASILASNFPTASQEARSARVIVEASERASQLTRQMLAYSGHGRFVVAPVDLAKAAVSVRDTLGSSVPRNISFKLDLAADLPQTEADDAQIHQLLMNLVVNAIEAIGTRPGTITVGTREALAVPATGRIETGTPLAPGPYVVVTVKDSGAGMDEPTLASIFDPFFSTKFTGRGLGLPAVLGIVRGHRGAIRVESTPGEGSLFEVYLAASEQRSQTVQPAAVTRPCVLVVDPEEGVRQVTRLVLEQQGFPVVLAASGKEAVRIFQDRKEIGLVVLDLTWSGRSSEDTLSALRGIRRDLVVIGSSGLAVAEAREQFGNGIAGFLQKPYTANMLIQAVFAALGSKTGPSASAKA